MINNTTQHIFRTIPEDEFFDDYKPVKNHLASDNGFDGYLYETYGDELEFVCQQPNKAIWTLVDGDSEMCILSGYHLVNRLGYFITARHWETESHVPLPTTDE